MNGNKSLYPIWLGVLGVALLAGLVAAAFIFIQGHVLFNANDVLIWTLPLGVYIFLALSSSGLTLLAALPLVFGIKKYEPFAKRLVFLSIATLCGGFVAIGLELGSVFHMIYIMLSPNLSSPIWWMGAIYSVELAVLALKFWKMHTGDYHSSFSKLLGTASFVLALIAPLMIGSVFGLTESRATYFGPMMSIYCLLMAVLSGTALFILYSMVVGRVTATASSGEYAAVLYDDFTLILTYAAGIVMVFTLLKIIMEVLDDDSRLPGVSQVRASLRVPSGFRNRGHSRAVLAVCPSADTRRASIGRRQDPRLGAHFRGVAGTAHGNPAGRPEPSRWDPRPSSSRNTCSMSRVFGNCWCWCSRWP